MEGRVWYYDQTLKTFTKKINYDIAQQMCRMKQHVENRLAWWRHVYTASVYTWRHHVNGMKKLAFGKKMPQIGQWKPIFFTIKKLFSKNPSTRIILALDAIIVPNLMFLGLLGPKYHLEEKQSPTQTPNLFHHFSLRNNNSPQSHET